MQAAPPCLFLATSRRSHCHCIYVTPPPSPLSPFTIHYLLLACPEPLFDCVNGSAVGQPFLRPTPSPASTASTELCTLEWQLQCLPGYGSNYGYSSELRRPTLAPLLRQLRRKSIKVGLFHKRRTQRGSQRAAFSVWVNCAGFPSRSLLFSPFSVVFSVEATATGQRLRLTKLALISFRLEFSKSAVKVNFIDSKREIQFKKLFGLKLVQREF